MLIPVGDDNERKRLWFGFNLFIDPKKRMSMRLSLHYLRDIGIPLKRIVGQPVSQDAHVVMLRPQISWD